MNNKYNLISEDFSDPHDSNEFFVRMQQVYDNSNHTLDSLSNAIGVPRRTLGRFLSHQTHTDVLRMIYDVAAACGIDVKLLFDRTLQVPNQELTGIKTIDRMLVTAYNGASISGCDGFAKTCSADYRLRHHRWRMSNNTTHDRVTQLLELDDEGYPSLSLQSEIQLNEEVARANNVTKKLFLHRAYFAGETLTVQYSIQEINESPHENKYTIRDTLPHTDHINLEYSLSEYTENARLVPKIKIRQWAFEKKFRTE